MVDDVSCSEKCSMGSSTDEPLMTIGYAILTHHNHSLTIVVVVVDGVVAVAIYFPI